MSDPSEAPPAASRNFPSTSMSGQCVLADGDDGAAETMTLQEIWLLSGGNPECPPGDRETIRAILVTNAELTDEAYQRGRAEGADGFKAEPAELVVPRLRRVAKLAGVASALPQDDETAYATMFTCLGIIANALERSKEAPTCVEDARSLGWSSPNIDLGRSI